MRAIIVGRGRVGKGLARSLRRRGQSVTLHAGHWTPTRQLRRSLVILTVPDSAIAECAERIAGQVGAGTVVVHCAGARRPEELSACAEAGASIGVLHPLVSFADPRRAPSLEGTTFVIDGSPEAVRVMKRLARVLGAHTVTGTVHGGAYHAAAALVANGAAALTHVGVRIVETLGVERAHAERAMAALLRTVADNITTIGLPNALTGPVARGDRQTVEAHLTALAGIDPRARDVYRQAAYGILDCALEAGLDRGTGRTIKRLLDRR